MKTFGTIGDLWKTFLPAYYNNTFKPKKITLDLSEDQTFYHVRMYVDDGYMECKCSSPNFIDSCNVLYDFEDKDETICTITIPEE